MSDMINAGWEMTCVSTGCPLAGITYVPETDSAECGGCNAVYEKPQ